MRTLTALDKRKLAEADRIKTRVSNAGLTFRQIDRTYGLRRCAASDALTLPDQTAERAIAAALGTKPHFLWPTRYHATGQRRQQQDYSRPPTLAQRRKFAEAQT